MPEIHFPDHFRFGTSTSAVQIETAHSHDWEGLVARDNEVFGRTTDHEILWSGDLDIIAGLAPAYRMSLMWSKLQPGPFQPLDPDGCRYYHAILQGLRDRGVEIMMVIHHFSNPKWFAECGGWAARDASKIWMDYVRKLVEEFGMYTRLWNTFNEPNLYVNLAYLAGLFPPRRTNFVLAWRALSNMRDAHIQAYEYLHTAQSDCRVGISHNAAVLEPENFMGHLPAALADWWYMKFIPDCFKQCDFFGMSYYARIGFDPFPVTWLDSPEKIRATGKVHDDMWEYHPQGLLKCLRRFHNRYGKPIIITENGVCTNDDAFRIKAISDYAVIVHQAIQEGIDVRAYYHWTAWDNFEWHLGPSYRFGLYGYDKHTRQRVRRASADHYAALAFSRSLTIN